MPHIKILSIIQVMIVLLIAGCAEDPAKLSSKQIAKEIRVETDPNNKQTWLAPVLETRHFRTTVKGYDTVHYRLSAIGGNQSSNPVIYRLMLNANYAGAVRHYDVVKFANGTAYPTTDREHETKRCQSFNSLETTCLYHDSAAAELSRADLESGRQSGLSVTLGSADQDYEHIELPAHYIDGFLLAVQQQP